MRTGLLLAVCIGVLFVPAVLTGRVYLAADYLKWYYPWRATGLYDLSDPRVQNYGTVQDPLWQLYPSEVFAAAQWRRGQPPLWDPRPGAGLPLVGQNLLPTFFPLHVLAGLVLEPLAARTLEQALALLVSGFGMNLFLRALGRSPAACNLGSLAWVLGGWPIVWMQFTSWLWASACLPWVLLYVERRDPVRLALSVGLLLLAGSHQVSLLGLGTAALYALTRRAGWPILGGALAGVALAAFTLIPAACLIAESGRLATAGTFAQTRLVPQELVTALWPFYLGDPAEGFYLGGSVTSQVVNGREHALYSGVLTLLLALAGICGGAPRLWTVLLAGSLLIALNTPLTWAFQALCPPARSLPLGRVLYLASLSLAVLAAYGWDAPRRRPFPQLATALALGLGATVLVTCWRVQTNPAVLLTGFADLAAGGVQKPPYFEGAYGPWLLRHITAHFVPWHPHVWLPFVWLGLSALALARRHAPLALGVLAADLTLFAATVNVPVPAAQVYPATPATTHLQGLRLNLPAREPPRRVAGLYRLSHPNTLTVYGLADVGAYASLLPRHYRELLNHLDGEERDFLLVGLYEARHYGPRAADLLGVGCHYTDPQHELPLALGRPDYRGDLTMAPWTTGLRWSVVGRARPGSLPDERFDPQTEVLLESLSEPVGELGPVGEVVGVHYDAHAVSARARLSRPGWVVLSDLYYPGWTATVDGQPAELLRANHCFRAVRLEAGEHTVEMSYTPPGFYPGLAVSMLTLLALGYECRRGKGSVASRQNP